MAPITYVWVLCRGEQHEGGSVEAVYGAESAANTAFINAADDLRKHWAEVYEVAASKDESLEEYLRESTEIGDNSKAYYCACDYVLLTKWQVQ